MSPTPFTHLHVHSDYSLLDGCISVGGLVEEAARCEMPALALTDHGNMYGAVEFYTKARKAGVNPIIGCEAYLVKGDATTKPVPGEPRRRFHITLLARDRTGFENLSKLSSLSWLKGFHRKPCLDKSMLAAHSEGLIALSGCLSGEVSRHLLDDDVDAAVAAAEEYADILGRENFYLEVMDNGIDVQRKHRAGIDEVARRTGLKRVATNDVHYRCEGDHVAQDALICIGTGQRMHDPNRRFKIHTEELYFRTSEQMAELFDPDGEEYRSTAEIAERCDIQLDLDSMHLPRFDIPTEETPEEYLRRLCEEGLARKYGAVDGPVRERFEKELAVIDKMGFTAYFLIVWDLIRFARENGIPVGPGRGSAAGSIVAYSLDITQLDPLRYDLLFERFLNADRISMPDIDIDFCRDRREDVIEYARRKYGEEQVCQIVTFGTMAARAAVRDAGRVLEVPLGDVDRICKRIPIGPKVTLSSAVESDDELRQMFEETEQLRELLSISRRIEGFARHTSTHAAGVVITDRPLIEHVPLCVVQGETNTQFQMSDLESIGLLKMDFLGLKNLTILEKVRRLVERTHGVDIDYQHLPLEDAPTYELLKRADTTGVFQLESSGMRELIAKLQPDCFEDIIALIALYRPGPLKSGMVDNFVQRKHGNEAIDYIHPAMEPVLRDTYGVIVYQEQVMRLAHELGGLSLNDADGMRKAMGKKQLERMQSYQAKFLEGAVGNGIPEADALRIWELMALFAEYGFNKSHSAAYGLITFWTAYMKAHYPGEFMAALMSCDAGNTEKLAAYVEEARRDGREVRAPDINASHADFTLEGEAIRFGFNAIKGVGSRLVEALVQGRDEAGHRFTAITDVLDHVDVRALNRASFEALAKAGVFDELEDNRHALLGSAELLLRDASREQADRHVGQASLFGGGGGGGAPLAPPAVRLVDAPEPSDADIVTMEKESLGLCLTVDRLARWRPLLRLLQTHELWDLGELNDRAEVIVGGMITGLRVTVVSKGRSAGRSMALFKIAGSGGTCGAVVFSDTYERHRETIVDESVIFCRGVVDRSRDEPAILVDEIYDPSEAKLGAGRRLLLDLRGGDAETTRARLDALAALWPMHRGPTEAILKVPTADGRTSTVRLGPDHRVGVTIELVEALDEIVGADRVHLH